MSQSRLDGCERDVITGEVRGDGLPETRTENGKELSDRELALAIYLDEDCARLASSTGLGINLDPNTT